VSNEILVQFAGFKAEGLLRVYSFTVREQANEPREFTVSIANEAFDARRVRYQDAPDVCSLKLRRELATYANHPPSLHYKMTDAELEDYRGAHAPRVSKNPFSRKTHQEQ
jgi:hypothetical protein